MKQVKVALIKSGCRYQIVQFDNGFYGVNDTQHDQRVAYGMTLTKAVDWALRLSLRHTHGI